jgi:protease-4
MSEEKKSVRSFLGNIFFPVTATLDFLQKYFKGILLLLLILLIIGAMQQEAVQKPNLITIKLKGAILNADKVLKQIEEAKKPNYKGVLFIIDSPGGAVAPSIEISRAVKRLRAKKPVVVYATGTLASGGYYSAIWGNKIIANPGTIVGSIGVIMETPMIKGLLDKVGVKPQIVKAGKYKEVGTPFRPWKEYEKKELEKVITDTYEMFVKEVCQARGLKYEERDKFADAHIFTAHQAKAVGLVDEVGTIERAKKETQKLAKVKKAVWKKPSKLEEMLKEFSEQTSSKLASLLLGYKLF